MCCVMLGNFLSFPYKLEVQMLTVKGPHHTVLKVEQARVNGRLCPMSSPFYAPLPCHPLV